MIHSYSRNIFKSAISLIMVLLLLLPLVLTSCTAEDAPKSSFNWNMTKEEYAQVANEKITYVISELFPSVYEQNKDRKAGPILFGGARNEFIYQLFGYHTDAWVSVSLTQDLKLDNVTVNGPLWEYEQLTEDQVEQLVTKLQKSAEPYGVTLTEKDISFEEEDGEIMARCYVRVQTDDGWDNEPLYEKIDPSWTKIKNGDTSEKELRKKTDDFVKKMLDLPNLSDYSVSLKDNKLRYRFNLGGYETQEVMTFTYSSEMMLEGIAYSDYEFDTPSDYLGIVTDDQLDSAFEALKKSVDGKLDKKDCILGTEDQYLTMYFKGNVTQKHKVCTVYEPAKDELAAIKEKDPSYTPDYTGLSDEYVQMRKQADAAITKKYGIQSFSNYDVHVGEYDSFFGVKYILMIGGLETEEVLYVSFDRNYNQTSIHGNFGEWSWLFAYIDPEEIEATIKRLDEEFVEETGLPVEESSAYITIDDNKNLVFRRDAIIDTEPGQGESHSDHYHYSQTEYLFVYNSLKKTSK